MFHRFELAHVLPRASSERLRPVLYNSWEATGFNVDEAGQKALAEKAARIGVERFVMDDGWFGARASSRAGLGEWIPNPNKFPHGLGPLIEHVHKLGMDFGLWVEPEMVNADSDLYLMPVIFPSFVRRRGNELSRLLHARGVRMGRIAEMWNAYASLTESDNRQAFVRTLRAVIDPGGQTVSAGDRLYLAARMPTLIVWGEQDDIIPVAHALFAHEAIPHSRLEVIPEAGHFPHVETPERFLEVLLDFLDTAEPARFGAADLQHLLYERAPLAADRG